MFAICHSDLLNFSNIKLKAFTPFFSSFENKIKSGISQPIKMDVFDEKPRSRMRKSIDRFTKKTTIHGVAHISRGDSICHTFMWFILLTLSLAALVYFLVYNVLNYLKYDVIGNENVYIAVPLELPAITITVQTETKLYH